MRIVLKPSFQEKSRWMGVVCLGLSWTLLATVGPRILEEWMIISDFSIFLNHLLVREIFFLIGLHYF